MKKVALKSITGERAKMHKDKIAGGDLHENKIARSQTCTKPSLHKGKKLHGKTKFHKDNFAPRVNFTRVTFLHESKKYRQIKISRIKKLKNK